jgi:hypothetical protein
VAASFTCFDAQLAMSRLRTILALVPTPLNRRAPSAYGSHRRVCLFGRFSLIARLHIFAVLCTSALGNGLALEVSPLRNTRVSLPVPFQFTLAPTKWTVNERYDYWRPEFPKRWNTPEKEKAATTFLAEYNALIRRIKTLIEKINSPSLNRCERKQASAEVEAKIEPAKALEPEISLFFRH